jgi:hypothetical protein
MQGGGSLSHVILVSQGFDEQEEECPAEKNLTNYESKFGDLCLFLFYIFFLRRTHDLCCILCATPPKLCRNLFKEFKFKILQISWKTIYFS